MANSGSDPSCQERLFNHRLLNEKSLEGGTPALPRRTLDLICIVSAGILISKGSWAYVSDDNGQFKYISDASTFVAVKAGACTNMLEYPDLVFILESELPLSFS